MKRTYSIEAKPTEYKGILYRSQLEANWASFFHSLGIPFVYEYKSYRLGQGLVYLPDFYLPLAPYRVVEIKPTSPVKAEIYKCRILSRQVVKVAIFVGQPSLDVEIYLFENGRRKSIKPDWSLRLKCLVKRVSLKTGLNMLKLNMVLGERKE